MALATVIAGGGVCRAGRAGAGAAVPSEIAEVEDGTVLPATVEVWPAEPMNASGSAGSCSFGTMMAGIAGCSWVESVMAGDGFLRRR